MKFENSFELCRYVKKNIGNEILLSFSCGKDSIAAWLFLREQGFKIYPFYEYIIPDLNFVNTSIEYYQNFFDTEIKQYPHPTYLFKNKLFNYSHFYENNDLLLYINRLSDDELKTWGFEAITDFAKEDFKISYDTYTALGIRQSENPQRLMQFKRYGQITPAKNIFYPIFDFKNSFIFSLLNKYKIKLPIDYKIFGKSFDGLDYRFIRQIKKIFS